jgi:hypothetical protein
VREDRRASAARPVAEKARADRPGRPGVGKAPTPEETAAGLVAAERLAEQIRLIALAEARLIAAETGDDKP